MNDTPRPTDWRDAAACRGEDPDLFFPKGYEGPSLLVIEQAKAVCRRCPVMEQCGQWAMETCQPFGVWGGLSEAERRTILRRRGVRLPAADEARPERTLASLLTQHAKPTPDGHLIWEGSTPVHFQGRYHTPAQISFTVDRGHSPVGILRRSCPMDGCILAAHIADNEERTQCGTLGGYRRHLQEKTTVCGPCRQADVDNRMRAGTTKVAV